MIYTSFSSYRSALGCVILFLLILRRTASSTMVILPLLFLLAALFIPNGYGIKCNVCQAQNGNGCQTPNEVTCQAPYDRCFTQRSLMQMGPVKVTMEMRNCTVGAMFCTEASKQKMCNMTGIKSCNYSCCQGDLCNDGNNPSGSGLTPSKPASNKSLSCYECMNTGMGPNGTGTPFNNCNAPKQRKCGEIGPGMPFDRCVTVKSKVKNPSTGALVEQEMKNCSLSAMCSTSCNNMNSTGNIVECNAQCCEGNLCNIEQPQTTTGPTSPSGPKAGQTPLAVSGILAIISIIMALLFK